MERLITIRADRVRVGNRLFNRYAKSSLSSAWVRVLRIDAQPGEVRFETDVYTEHRHPAEAVAVMRKEESR